jgi:hypothetical protein
MQVFKQVPFKHGNKNYEIRIMVSEKRITILAFYNNYPANNYRYQIQLSKNTDPQSILEKDIIDHFITLAKDDVLTNR